MTKTYSLWAYVRFTQLQFQYVSRLNFTIKVNQEKCFSWFTLYSQAPKVIFLRI